MTGFRRVASAFAAAATISFTVVVAGSASAAPAATPIGDPAAASSTPGLAGELVGATGGTARFSAGAGSKLDFVGGSGDHPLAVGNAADPGGTARAFVDRYGPLLGAGDRGQLVEHSSVTAPDGGHTVRYQQSIAGVPVLGGDVSVRVDGGGQVLSLLGHASSAPTGAPTPVIDAAAAGTASGQFVASDRHVDSAGLTSSPPSLQWYDPSVLDRTKAPSATLVWKTEVFDPSHHIQELVLVDAGTGAVTFHADEIEHAINRDVCEELEPNRCHEEGGPPTSSTEVEQAYLYAGDTYSFYSSRFGRDGIDGRGMPIRMLVDDFENDASWNFFSETMVFGTGFATDDIVGHEMTHGVTEFTSNLMFFGQSGAINESMSDVFGEFVDLTNGHGNDDPSVRWLEGEESAIGPIRNMADPTQFGQPDRLRSPLYATSGVFDPHSGGGVNNKADFLITDGGTFNGQTVTGLGIDKASRIYYETNANLLVSASDYDDLGHALVQACTNLLGTHGIVANDCAQVQKAVAATEMTLAPTDPQVGHVDAPVCPPGQAPRDLFHDDMEDPLSGTWLLDNQPGQPGAPGWGYETFAATSGQRSLTAALPGASSDKRAQMSHAVALPVGQPAFLRFSHAEAMSAPFPGPIGGTVEYSTDGGTTWINLGNTLTDNPYNGTVFNAATGAVPAFVDVSPDFYASRASLAALAGQNVQFRFRMLSALPVFETAWLVDDVRVYTCTASPTAPGAPTGAAAVGGVGQAVVSWDPPTSDGGSSITGYTVTASPGGATTTVAGDARSGVVPGLNNGTTYTFTVKATNGIGSSGASPPSSPAAVTAQGGALFHPLTPARIVDSRDGTGTAHSPWTAQESRSFAATGAGGVPAGHVSSIVANITVTDAAAASHLTVWPAGQPRPNASNLNFVAGQTVANHVTIGVGSGGQVSIFNNAGQVDVIVDVLGYYDDGTTGGDAFVPVTPTRLLDSRDGTGTGTNGSTQPWGDGEARNVTVAGGSTPVPADATAVVLNVTGVFPSADTHISVWPTGQPLPATSSVNVPQGGVVPNLVTVKVGSGGQVRLRNNAGTVHLIADVVGYYAPRPSGGRFVPLAPHRIVDSRDGTGVLGVPWAFVDHRDIQVAGDGGVPAAGASTVVLNVTAVGASSATHITCYPGSTGRPVASNLNLDAGQTAPNQVIVGLGARGDIACFNNDGTVHLVVDVVGYMT